MTTEELIEELHYISLLYRYDAAKESLPIINYSYKRKYLAIEEAIRRIKEAERRKVDEQQ